MINKNEQYIQSITLLYLNQRLNMMIGKKKKGKVVLHLKVKDPIKKFLAG